MKEETIEYEVQAPKEITSEQYISDLTGEPIDDDNVLSLIVPEQTDISDSVSERLREKNPYDDYDMFYEEHRIRDSGYQRARRDVETILDEEPTVITRDTIHLSVREYAHLKGCDVDDIDANSEIPDVYAEMVNPSVESTSWLDVDGDTIDFTNIDDIVIFLSLIASLLAVAIPYLFGIRSNIVALIAICAICIFGCVGIFILVFLVCGLLD